MALPALFMVPLGLGWMGSIPASPEAPFQADTIPPLPPAICVREYLSRLPGQGPPEGDQEEICTLQAHFIGEGDRSPILDGRLDDPAWEGAQVATGFRQLEPVPLAVASERTEARVAYDGRALYVAMRMYDTSSDSIRAQFVMRDDYEAISDWAHVLVDSYHDRRTAFEFATTPRGARADILHLEDTGEDVTWDAVWEVATGSDAEGWVAEFRIPLSQLRFAGGESATWGINFKRRLARRSEVAFWAAVPPNAGRMVSLFGDLTGLEGLESPGRLEVLPYSAARVTRAPGDPEDPFYEENDLWGSAGVDLKYGLTSDFTLTATVNPDFGQVEADSSQVNLTAFETFFPERRPFFTEGTEIFRFPLVPEGHAFYSRRIGANPHVTPSVEEGGYVNGPENVRILGAMKISGKTESGWSVGLLDALTGRAEAEVAQGGNITTQPVEPLTNYAAARIMRDFRAGRSGVGIIATGTHRRLNDQVFDRLRSAAYSGGVDGWHRFGPGSNLEVNGWILGSHVRGSETAIAAAQRSGVHFFQRPDADHLTYDPGRTSLSGWAGELFLERIGGGAWTWAVGGGARSPGVDVNDLGFLTYTDVWYAASRARYQDFIPGRLLRNWWVEGELVWARTFGMKTLRPSLHLRTTWDFTNFWRATLNTDRWRSHLWPWELRGGPALRRSGYTNVRATLRSDSRKPWSLNLRGTLRLDDQGGSRIARIDPRLELRPSARATVLLGPLLNWTRDADQYVARATNSEGEVEYVVGYLDQTTAALTLRMSYGFGPDLTLDVYAQPFLSCGSVSDFRTVAEPQARDFHRRLPLIDSSVLEFHEETGRYHVIDAGAVTPEFTFRDPDFNVREFLLNAVLRWEYRPGSTLFVVWSQGRADDTVLGDFSMSRDLDHLFQTPSTNVFMVKVDYWVGF
jgi:hypothetical protein